MTPPSSERRGGGRSLCAKPGRIVVAQASVRAYCGAGLEVGAPFQTSILAVALYLRFVHAISSVPERPRSPRWLGRADPDPTASGHGLSPSFPSMPALTRNS